MYRFCAEVIESAPPLSTTASQIRGSEVLTFVRWVLAGVVSASIRLYINWESVWQCYYFDERVVSGIH